MKLKIGNQLFEVTKEQEEVARYLVATQGCLKVDCDYCPLSYAGIKCDKILGTDASEFSSEIFLIENIENYKVGDLISVEAVVTEINDLTVWLKFPHASIILARANLKVTVLEASKVAPAWLVNYVDGSECLVSSQPYQSEEHFRCRNPRLKFLSLIKNYLTFEQTEWIKENKEVGEE